MGKVCESVSENTLCVCAPVCVCDHFAHDEDMMWEIKKKKKKKKHTHTPTEKHPHDNLRLSLQFNNLSQITGSRAV